MHPHMLHELGKARHNDLLREADQHRLVKQARAGRPSLRELLSRNVGAQLVRAGEWLKRQAATPQTGTFRLAEE